MLMPPRHRGAASTKRDQYARDPKTRLMWSNRDLSVLCRDGRELSVDFALTPHTLLGKPWSVASIRDNSVQQHAELARVEAVERFRLAFEEKMAPMICTDLEDRIIAANDAFCEMVEFAKEDLIGHDSTPFTFPDDVGITEGTDRRVTSGEADQVRYVKHYLHQDGRVIVAEVSRSRATPTARPRISFFPNATSPKSGHSRPRSRTGPCTTLSPARPSHRAGEPGSL
jgi:PAS domain S-box-containing protein